MLCAEQFSPNEMVSKKTTTQLCIPLSKYFHTASIIRRYVVEHVTMLANPRTDYCTNILRQVQKIKMEPTHFKDLNIRFFRHFCLQQNSINVITVHQEIS